MRIEPVAIRRIFQRGITVLLLAGSLTLSGCLGTWCLDESAVALDNSEPDAAKVLTNCRLAAALPQKEQEELFPKLRKDFEQEANTETRFNLVCLALQPPRTRQDRVWARDLLRDYRARKEPREDLTALAWLLESLLDRQLTTEQKLDEERKRADTLAGKLKALEDIEKIIRQREDGGLAPTME